MAAAHGHKRCTRRVTCKKVSTLPPARSAKNDSETCTGLLLVVGLRLQLQVEVVGNFKVEVVGNFKVELEEQEEAQCTAVPVGDSEVQGTSPPGRSRTHLPAGSESADSEPENRGCRRTVLDRGGPQLDSEQNGQPFRKIAHVSLKIRGCRCYRVCAQARNVCDQYSSPPPPTTPTLPQVPGSCLPSGRMCSRSSMVPHCCIVAARRATSTRTRRPHP